MISVLHSDMRDVFWGLVRTPPEEQDMDQIQAAAENLCDLYAMLDKQLDGRAYIAGDQLTMGDIPVGCATYRWYGLDVPHPDFPNLRRWYESLTERDAFQKGVMIPIT